MPVRVTDQVLKELDTLSTLAPLHNPPALAAMRVCRKRLSDVPIVAVFDTAFFHDLPAPARVYALPSEWRRGIRRFGFHGLAHRYLSKRCHEQTGARRIVTLQLGNGCSMAAIENGRPLDTSMGFTPLEGLIMASRGGDIDSGLLLHLMRQGLSTTDLADGLNHRAGLLGLSDVSADMRELLRLEESGCAGAKLAIAAFCHRARKYLGAYAAVLGGLDAVVFGGGIGEHAPSIRARICAKMNWCGLVLDSAANARVVGTEARISAEDAQVTVRVVPVNEELLIARETGDALIM
jgi:acetate kinase